MKLKFFPRTISIPPPMSREPYELRSRSRVLAAANALDRWSTRNRDGTLITPLRGWPGGCTVRFVVKTLTGKAITLDECPDDITLLGLKERVRDHEGIPPEMQRLVWAGYALADDAAQIMRDYGIMWDSTFHLVLRCAGD